MPTLNCFAKRLLPLGIVLTFVLAGCSDREPTGAQTEGRPAHTQVASAPVVNSLLDNGDGNCTDAHCTLREAIAFADPWATITFAVTGVITLTQGPIQLMNVTLAGPGAANLIVSGNNATRVFTVVWVTATISGMTLTSGYNAAGGGGAIWMDNAILTLTDCVVQGNTAQFGGGIFSEGDRLTIRSSTIAGNQAVDGEGGGIYTTAPLLVENSTISGNSASNVGGGITSFTSTGAVIRNSTISGNSASDAGGIANLGGLVSVAHSTIIGNTGGGVRSSNGGATRTDVKGSIIWGNNGADVSAQYTATRYNSLGYNLVGTAGLNVDFTLEFNQTSDQTNVTNALLGTLALNAPGHTATHALLAGSPAIDAGVCTDVSGGTVSADQRGVTRPQGSACDIGAYEVEAAALPAPNFAFDLSALPAMTYGNDDFSVLSYASSSNSTGAITFGNGIGSVGCSVASGGTVTITGAATGSSFCVIEASLASDGTWAAAGPIAQSFNIAKATGAVSISNIPVNAIVGGSFSPTYITLNDGTAATASLTTSVCTVAGGVVSYNAAGTCTLQASVTEGINYAAVTGAAQSFDIAPGVTVPVFTFDLSALPALTFGNPGFNATTYVTTNSTGTVSFATGAGSVGCAVTPAGVVTITGAAVDPSHCILTATLAPDATYAGAGPVQQEFNVAKAAGSVTITNIPATASVGGTFTPALDRDGDGVAAVVSQTTNVCTVTGGVVSFDAEGICTLVASVGEGTNHLSASGVPQSFTIGPAGFRSTCTFKINPKNDQRIVRVWWQQASPGVTLIKLYDGRILTKQLAPTADGSWLATVKTIGTLTYELRGGTSRKDNGTVLLDQNSAQSNACVLEQ